MSATIIKNKKAFHNYEITDKFEAGVVLVGTEVKSLRDNKVQMADAYCRVRDNEIWVVGLRIAPYEHGNIQNHQESRERKLLLHRREIDRLMGKIQQDGLALIPLSLYWKKNRVKIELGLGRGKKLHDKRESEKKKDAKREIARALKDR